MKEIKLLPSMSTKIQGCHLDRLAIVYIRQSTLQQVEKNKESTKLQYGLVARAEIFGWSPHRILVIDEDLGRSGATAEGRPGFQRLVAEVGLNHVGIIFGIEMSRLARSNRDWHHLLEVCGIFDTLIADTDGVYDPTAYNDRLLLGLKGTMSEAELHIIKQRMLEGKLAKARRGELGMRVPSGYILHPSGEIRKDPDEQAQAVIRLVFELFGRFATLHRVLRYLVENNIQMPHRVPTGINKGDLSWRRPNRMTLSNLLHNPIYAGAYVYGRRPTDPRKKIAGRPSTGRIIAKPEEWKVLKKDYLPAYINWEQYEHNVRQLMKNTSQGTGVIRNGPSLLSGLVICNRCNLKMATQYTDNGKGLRYVCSRMCVDYAAPLCQSLTGKILDEFVTESVLEAMQPAALEVSLKVAEDIDKERQQLQAHWKQRLERAQYEVERAKRQYNGVEPENRLVARNLEKQWEESLIAEEKLKREYDQFLNNKALILSVQEREAIRQLAVNIPAIWDAPTTTNADRQSIVRQLIDSVKVNVQGNTEQVDVKIQWAGGHETVGRLMRPVGTLEQFSRYPELIERIHTLYNEGHSVIEICKKLTEENWRTPKRGQAFKPDGIRKILQKEGISKRKKQIGLRAMQLTSNEWTVSGLATKLGMPEISLYNWLKKGKLSAKLNETVKPSQWVIFADELEIARLQALRIQPRRWSKHIRIDNT
jgi:DNA invertase Pin-like site-specific DNA recombinase